MASAAPLQPSGIGPVDAAWGGLARPGAYLLVGAARQGRLHLSAQTLAASADDAPAILFSGREPADVVAVAREAGADLEDAYARGRVRLLRVPPAPQLAGLGEDGLARALADLAAASRGASRVVVEDFTPFVQFRSFEAFTDAFRRLVASVAAHGATLVLGLGEPANDGSRRLLAFVEGEVTGTLRLAGAGATLELLRGKGHAGAAREVPWSRTGAPPPSLFAEAALFTEAPLSEPAGGMPEDPFPAHGSDGYAGDDAASLDAGAFVVSTAPAEPFGYPAESRAVPLPAPFGPESLPADPFVSVVTATPVAAAPAPAASATAVEEPAVEAPDPFGEPDGDGWATIQPVALSDEAPVVVPPGLDPMATGFLVDSDIPGQAVPPVVFEAFAAEALAPPVPFIVAPLAPAAIAPAAPPAGAPPAAAAEVAEVAGSALADEDPEAAFADDLAAAFAGRASTPFLVVALRLAPGSPFFGTFPAVADGLLGALTGSDRALVRDDEAKLAVLLPSASADAPQRLLGAVRAHLAGLLGDEADEALRAVGVLVLPNGEPFTDPKELVAYVMG